MITFFLNIRRWQNKSHKNKLLPTWVLRLEGASKGADEDVRIAKERGLKVYYRLEDVPPAEQ